MQMLNIIVVRPGNVRVGQCNGVDAEVGALIRDAFDVRQRIQKAESAVDRAFCRLATARVLRAERLDKVIDDLLHRLDVPGDAACRVVKASAA